MTATTYEIEVLIKAARAAAEAFLASLDESKSARRPLASERAEPGRDVIEYDPLHDDPPFKPDPKEGASDAEKQMAYVTYLGAIGRLNAEEGRGAVSKEISEFAKKAGYSGGNAVNGWNSRPGSPRAIEVVDGARFLNEDAFAWIQKDAARLGIKIVGEIAAVPAPKK